MYEYARLGDEMIMTMDQIGTVPNRIVFYTNTREQQHHHIFAMTANIIYHARPIKVVVISIGFGNITAGNRSKEIQQNNNRV